MNKTLSQIDFRAFVMANNGKPVTTSMAVAQAFKKRHDDVLRKIRVLIAALKKNNLHHHVRNFTEMLETVEVGNGAKRQTPVFEMNLDGFTLLAMGFNGDEALVFKTSYIDAFNWMQNLITQQGLTLAKRHNLLSLKFLITYKIPPRLTIRTILYLGLFKMMENGHVKESNTVPKGLQFNGVIPRLRHGRTMHESII